MHEYYIDKIIHSDDTNKMEELKDLLNDTISYLKMYDEDEYEKVECNLYEIVEGKKLSKEKAEEWVESMSPDAEWTYEETENVRKEYDVSIPAIATYILMNMGTSDYRDLLGDPKENLDKYIKFAEDWYYDKDTAKKEDEKLYCYWKHIVK